MKIAYLDCTSGVSGDMMLGALVDCGVDLNAIQLGVQSLAPQIRLVAEEVKRHGFRATKIHVEFPHEHAHRHLHHINEMIDGGDLTSGQKDLAKRIFLKLGAAEARVHGAAVEKVHFHEVGALDSIADIVGSAIGWDLLAADRIACSAVPTGGGTIKIAHGLVSVPAPATAELLKGVPLAPSSVQAELTTPTGAAIVATLADQFGPLPPMTIDTIGYGAGSRDFEEQANVLRLITGHSAAMAERDQVCVLETNLDDCPGEIIGHCSQLLLEAGALDVYATAIQMKKGRPGVLLSVMCRPSDGPAMEDILFRETTTLGVRRSVADRRILRRQPHTVNTKWGLIEGKLGAGPRGTAFAPEYESCRAVAAQNAVSLAEVYDAARDAFRSDPVQLPPVEGG